MDDSLELLNEYARTRDAQAFAGIVKRYQGLVFSVCLREHRDPHRAEEAAQECFVKLAQQAVDVRASVSGWLHRCATRVCLQSIRSENARKRRERSYVQMHHDAAEPKQSDWDDIAPHIDEVIDQLPDAQRHLVIEHFLRQRPQAELAHELEVSPATVSRRLDTAVKALRADLRKLEVVTSVALLTSLLMENAVSAAPASLAVALGKVAIAGPGPGAAGAAATAAGGGAVLGVAGAKLAALGATAVLVLAVPVAVQLTTRAQRPLPPPAPPRPAQTAPGVPESREAPATAERRLTGAAAVAGPVRGEPTEPRLGARAAAFREHVAFLASDELGGRATGSEGMAEAAGYIAGALAEAGLLPAGDPGDYLQEFTANRKRAVNVVAVLPGAGELGAQAVLVTAHADGLGTDARRVETGEDGIHNSADDAGGVAALLMVAEDLGRERLALAQSRRAVVFVVYDAHEQGHAGVEHYRAHPAWPLDKTAAVIQLGGIGRARKRQVYAGHAACTPALQKRLEEFGAARGLQVETHVPCLVHSEYLTFLHAKIPAVLLYTGLHPDFRQVTDQVERVDCDSGARIVRLVHDLVRSLLVDTRSMKFHPPSPVVEPGTFMRAAQILGVNLAVDFAAPLPRAGSVAPGSIAARFGLQGGDELAGVNGMPVDRQEDVLALYGRHGREWFGRDLHLSLRRDGERVDVVVPVTVLHAALAPARRPLDDGSYEVTFTYRPRKRVQSVYLAGSFNGWKPAGLRMEGPDEAGLYSVCVRLPMGQHEYKFVHNGKDWEPDPRNPVRVGWFQNSLVFVGVVPE